MARRFHNPGDFVEPSAGDPVLRLVDPRRLEVIASIPLSDASRIRVGALGTLIDPPVAAGAVLLEVLTSPSAVDAGTASAPARLRFVRTISIPVGTPVRIEIQAEEHRNAVVIPESALVREGDETAVFVVIDGKARRRAVRTGLTDGTRVEILSGIAPADRVIVDGQAGLPDDAIVAEAPGPADANPSAPASDDAAK